MIKCLFERKELNSVKFDHVVMHHTWHFYNVMLVSNCNLISQYTNKILMLVVESYFWYFLLLILL